MNLLWPELSRRQLRAMLRVAAAWAALAGVYGALHDQVSYAISPEYFTKLKFDQFAWADAGGPRRLFASLVGFVATCWVGLIAGWTLARCGLTDLPPAPHGRSHVVRAFSIVAGAAVTGGCIAALLGVARTHIGDLNGWATWQRNLGLDDLPTFVVVAYLHWGGYLGALLGLVAAVVYVRNRRAGQ